ncbi:hypothetical protein THASP1DRAFT_7479, partial [Thamnocephalis sphaerospora]
VFDFEKQLVFYGSYHSHRINVLCHVVCVPLILWTAFVMTSPSGPIMTVESELLAKLPIVLNVPFFVSLLYASYYLTLEPIAGFLMTPVLIGMAATATTFYETADHPIQTAFALHAFAWVAQIFTHQVFEKRSPALLDNLFQALALAPLFVFLEVLFFFGYRPALKKRFQNEVGINVTKFRRER